jgi:zinc/manganese transport system substrate-binding protein
MLLVALLGASVLALAGCTVAAVPGPTWTAGAGPVPVVASTDVWGDVAKQVGGSHVTVTSIIHDPSQDPHEYEASPRDQLAVAKARIVLENGGGYDDFASRLASKAKEAVVLNAAQLSGLDPHPASGEFNEHLWYDLPVVGRVAQRLEAELSRLDPGHRDDYAANAGRFRSALAALEQREAAMRAVTSGKGVAITEPVPLYLTAALGLVNRTPRAFSSAVEQGTDVAPAVLRQQLALLTDHRVALLLYNEQTTGATTDQVLAAASRARVPVVGVRETLPAGKDYLSWMRSDLDALARAVGG